MSGQTAMKTRKEPEFAARAQSYQVARERSDALDAKLLKDSWAIRTGGAITSDLLAAAGLV